MKAAADAVGLAGRAAVRGAENRSASRPGAGCAPRAAGLASAWFMADTRATAPTPRSAERRAVLPPDAPSTAPAPSHSRSCPTARRSGPAPPPGPDVRPGRRMLERASVKEGIRRCTAQARGAVTPRPVRPPARGGRRDPAALQVEPSALNSPSSATCACRAALTPARRDHTRPAAAGGVRSRAGELAAAGKNSPVCRTVLPAPYRPRATPVDLVGEPAERAAPVHRGRIRSNSSGVRSKLRGIRSSSARQR